MPRRPTGYWDKRANAYFCRIGEISPKSGKARSVMLTDVNGQRLPYDGKPTQSGKVQLAIQKLLASREAERRSFQGPTVAEVCRAFVAWHRERGSAERTVDNHRFHLKAFMNFAPDGVAYGHRTASSIGVPDLTAMKQAMLGRGNQTGYLKLRYASILACWRWAARPVEGRDPVRTLASNPFDGIERPKRGRGRNQALPWPITRLLIRRAWGLAKTHPYHRPGDRDAERVKILRTLYSALTGSRPGEAARLRWDEIVWAQRIAQQEGKTTSRTGKLRRTPLTESLVKALSHLHRWPGRHPEYVFLTAATRKVKPPNGRECGVWFAELRAKLLEDDARRKPADRLGLPRGATLYWLRHDWQSFGLEVVSVEGVAAAAGNSPGVLLSTYEHTENRRIREVGDTIERGRRARRTPS
jgi:integrase